MDCSLLLKNISKHISLTEDEANYITGFFTLKQVKKKEMLLREGLPSKTFYYVHAGALKAYHLGKDGTENIIMFALNDWWVTDIYAFTTGNPAVMSISAIEDSTLLAVSKEGLDKILADVPKFEKFFRIIMQNSYVREQLRTIQNLSITAEERYINFVNKYPQFVQKISQKQIASYLGITPEFLSAIRKKLSRG
ncbi:MAG TPA: Crp/Fnr family transcriptional regulator [Chitinophagaceae bacterium]|nr:Crp/Fnr family transcriptional regulator [Chitinophagaceae bacterium]